MSYWTHINGLIEVCAVGRTQHEKEYIIRTVLDHLPIVGGSESDMEVHVTKKNGHNSSRSHDEFGMRTDKGTGWSGERVGRDGWFRSQDSYFIMVCGDLRDRVLSETHKEFVKWLSRLSKRIIVTDIIIKISGEDTQDPIFITEVDPWYAMFEDLTWGGDPTNWCQYLMWEFDDKTGMPKALKQKMEADHERNRHIRNL